MMMTIIYNDNNDVKNDNITLSIVAF